MARIVLLLLATLLAIGTGLFDRTQSEVQPAVLLLPLVDVFLRTIAIPAPWPAVPGSRMLAFLPAVLGAGIGALVGIAARQARPHWC